MMGKPDPIIYEAAAALLPDGPCVAIGDSLEHDIAGAQRAGIDSVFIEGGIHANEVAGLRSGGAETGIGEELASLFQQYAARPKFTLAMFAL